MAVFKNSRFKGSYLFLDEKKDGEGVMYLSPFRENVIEPAIDDFKIVFTEGMRLDILAKEYYGTERLDWVILDANPKYLTPFEIQVGDIINIPNPERVILNE